MDPKDVFHAKFYLLHNEKRLEHLKSLKLPIKKGSTVFEVGAGIGDHTDFFVSKGCEITTSDGRVENYNQLKEKFPNCNVELLDLENVKPSELLDKEFDIVYCYGTLYHLSNPEFALEYLAKRCKKMLLLETCVSFGSESLTNICPESPRDPSQSVSGKGCRPTRPWIFNKLNTLFDHVYMPLTQPNHVEFPEDWTVAPTNPINRAIFVASRNKINNKLLVEVIPQKQTRIK